MNVVVMLNWMVGLLWFTGGTYAILRGSSEGADTLSDYPEPAFKLDLVHDQPEYDHRALSDGSEVAPLFQGRGIHYAFLWVGTPAQRVSVIMDTGSHHTAFPCQGCKCGKHVSK
jgi:hypothetical protein